MLRLSAAIFISLMSWGESFTSVPTLLEGASSVCTDESESDESTVKWDAAALQKLYAEEGLLFTAFYDSTLLDHNTTLADLTYVCGGVACGGHMNPILYPDTSNPGQEPRKQPYLILNPNVTWKAGGCAYLQDAGDSHGAVSKCPGPGQIDLKKKPAELAKSFIEAYANATPPSGCKSHFDSWSTGNGGFEDPNAERNSFVATYNSFYQMLKPLIKSPPPQRKCKTELQMQENQINQAYCKSDVLAIGYTETHISYNGTSMVCKDNASIEAAKKLSDSANLPLIKMTRRSEGSIVPSDPGYLCKVLFSVDYSPITFTDATIEFITVM